MAKSEQPCRNVRLFFMLIAITRYPNKDISYSNSKVFIEIYNDNWREAICECDIKNKTMISTGGNYPQKYFSSIRQAVSFIKSFYIVKRTDRINNAFKKCLTWDNNSYPNARTKYHYEIIGVKSHINPFNYH